MKRPFLIFLIFILVITIVSAHEDSTIHNEESKVQLPKGLQLLINQQTQLALSITFLAAFIAGLISLSSPCGFVLLPTFLAYSFSNRKKAFFMTSAFSLGMIIAFSFLGIFASLISGFFTLYKNQLGIISGLFIVIFAFMVLLNKGFSFFSFKIDNNEKRGFFSFTIFGFLFSLGWTPCIGPVLSSIFFLAINLNSIFKSVLLLIFFSLGVVIPLLLISLFQDKFNLSRFIKGREIKIKNFTTTTYNLFSFIILFIIGVIMVIFKGTSAFEQLISSSTPWSMNILQSINDNLISSDFFKSSLANIIGIVVFIVIILLIIFKLGRNNLFNNNKGENKQSKHK